MSPRLTRRAASFVASVSVAAALALAPVASANVGAVTSNSSAVQANSASAVDLSEGPHADAHRKLAATTTTREDGVIVKDVDLGNITLGNRGQFRAPVRGVVVAPDKANAHAPLVMFAHQRYTDCVDDSVHFPCAGSQQLRLDRGMIYWAKAMAKQGYAVIIPDLGPLYGPADPKAPYSQAQAYAKTVEQLRAAVKSANAGGKTRLGDGLKGKVDTRSMAVIGHSRAGELTTLAVPMWQKAGIRITSVMMYGGYYLTTHGDVMDPMIGDVPYFGLMGSYDEDVKFASREWLTAHIEASRKSTAIVGVVPGFGHTYINRELSKRHIDDRRGCDLIACPGPAAHEDLFLRASSAWLNATVKHERSSLPMSATAMLGHKLASTTVSWLAVTPGRRTTAYLAHQTGTLQPLGKGASVKACVYPDPMIPVPSKFDCALPDAATIANAQSFIAQTKMAPGVGVRLRTNVSRATTLALHLAPSDDRTDHRPGSPLAVKVRTSSGRSVTLKVPASDPAVQNRATADMAGTYAISTVRLRLPSWVAATRVTGVDITGDGVASKVDIRAIDFAQKR